MYYSIDTCIKKKNQKFNYKYLNKRIRLGTFLTQVMTDNIL